MNFARLTTTKIWPMRTPISSLRRRTHGTPSDGVIWFAAPTPIGGVNAVAVVWHSANPAIYQRYFVGGNAWRWGNYCTLSC
jgi:hypothetical protein